jgi:hypothetical protein
MEPRVKRQFSRLGQSSSDELADTMRTASVALIQTQALSCAHLFVGFVRLVGRELLERVVRIRRPGVDSLGDLDELGLTHQLNQTLASSRAMWVSPSPTHASTKSFSRAWGVRRANCCSSTTRSIRTRSLARSRWNEFGPERGHQLRAKLSAGNRGRLPPGGFWPWPALMFSNVVESAHARIDLNQAPSKRLARRSAARRRELPPSFLGGRRDDV